MALHYDKYIPDEGPLNARILFVGEAGGETEHETGRPFMGQAGDMLMGVLNRNGLSRSEVRLANLFHFRPYGNDIKKVMQLPDFKTQLGELYSFIETHRPYVIVPLGNWPLAFLTGKKGIKKWRGSILGYIHDHEIKVIPTYHPSYILRNRSNYPTFDLDIKRIAADSQYREKRYPVRQYVIDPRGLELEEWTQRLCDSDHLGTDIETVKKSKHILCVGFAPTPETGVCIVPSHGEGRRAIERVLESNAKKIFQFGTFDTTQLKNNGYQINDPSQQHEDEYQTRPYYWDTLIAQHVLAPELPRSLEYLTSIYTREPYYKTEGRGSIPDDTKGWSLKVNKDSLYIYNAKDCCVTTEIALAQMAEIGESEQAMRMFAYEMNMLEVAHHISDSGLPIDKERRELLERVLLAKWAKLQFILDRLTGYETNVKSPKLKSILYDKDKLGLPTRRKRDGTITADEDAIVSLISFCKDKLDGVKRKDAVLDWTVKLNVCKTVLEIRGIRQVLSNYVLEKLRDGTMRASEDGRMRSTFKVGGTETGRWSAMKYVDSTGLNAQTFPRDPVMVDDSELTKVDGSIRLLSQLAQEADEDDELEEEEEAA